MNAQKGLFGDDEESEDKDPEDDELTLLEAKALFESQLKKGAHCPCCGEWSKQYDRHLNIPMVGTIEWMIQEFLKTRDWIHIPTRAPQFITKNREYGRLFHWGFLEPMMNEDRTKRRSGFWKPTKEGIRFVAGEIDAPEYYRDDRGEVLWWSEKRIMANSVRELPDYQKLMRKVL